MKSISTVAMLLCLGLTGETTAINPLIAASEAAIHTQTEPQESQKHLPIDSMYEIMAAEMALNRTDHEAAVQNYILAAQETQDAKIAERATQIALTVSSLEVAIEPALIWAKAAPSSLEANLTVAAIYIRLKTIDKAAHFLTLVEKLQPEQAYYHYLMVYRQLEGTNSKEVIDTFIYLVDVDKAPHPGALLALAEIRLAQEDFAKTEELSDLVLKNDPGNNVAIRLKTESLRHLKGDAGALEFLNKQVARFSDNTDLALFHVEYLINAQQFDLARLQLDKLVKTKLSPDQSLVVARTAMQAQWYDLAEKSLLSTLGSEAHQNTAHYLLARIAELQNKTKDAIKWYREVLSGPFHVMSQIKASQMLTDAKDYDEAIEILTNTQPQNEFDNKRLVLTLIDIYGRKKDYAAAVDVLDNVLNLQPEDTDYLYARAVNTEKLNLFSQSEKDLLQILAQDPYHVEALNALGYMLTIHTQRYDDALNYLKRALELSPNNASVLDSMGWLHYKMGNHNEALVHLRKAAEIMPDAEIAAHLGEVLWKLNNRDEAQAVWKSALKKNPDDTLINEAIKRLTSE